MPKVDFGAAVLVFAHANITMTLDYYTHVDACSVKAEMERLAA